MFTPPLSLSPAWLRIYDFLTRAWAWTRNFFSYHHIIAMFALTWATVKVGFAVVSYVFTSIAELKQSLVSATRQANQIAPEAGFAAGIFDLCNSIFPIWEFFVLVSLLFIVKSALWSVSAIRYVYKNIPLKGT